MDFQPKPFYTIDDLISIMALLRTEQGCPWDREQNHHTIRKNFLEETYEVLEAIDTNNPVLLKEELGDVLLQVVFHAQIEQEQNSFTFSDVCDGICKKLIVRHPHIFASTQVSGSADVIANWDAIKQQTKGQTTITQTLESVPKTFPALMRSEKVQHRAAKSGFDYPCFNDAMNDFKSEIVELEEAIAQQDSAHIDEEFGDLLFSAVNMSRFLNVDAENSLMKSCEKFISRFKKVEKLANQQNINMKTASIDELDKLWKQAKCM